MKKVLIIAGVLVGILALVALAVGGAYVSRRNAMVIQKEAITGAWSQVDVVIQRRSDLIPNLVATVKGYAAQETEIFSNIAEARARLGGAQTPADRIAGNEMLSGALSRLLVIVENYPDLKSNQNFLALQSQLEGTENRIAVARRDYITAEIGRASCRERV